jgi:tumor protein p53-inducible protein 3
MLSKTMRAVFAAENRCVTRVVDIPSIQPGEALLKVHYTALNRADLLQRMGKYNPPPGATDILGLEASGEIVAINSPSDSHLIGKKACALLVGGGYAEYVNVPVNQLLLLPPNMETNLKVAAAIPETWLTAYQLLFFLGKVTSSDTVLVHAAGSGVGIALCQYALSVGATVFAVAGSDDKLDGLKKLGVHKTFNYKVLGTNLGKEIAVNAPKGVSLILDPVGASFYQFNIEAIAMDGRWVLYGLMGGANPSSNNIFAQLMSKRVNLISTTLRNRSNSYKSELIQAFSNNFFHSCVQNDSKSLYHVNNDTKSFQVVIDKEFDGLDSINEALDLLSSNETFGKVVVKVA